MKYDADIALIGAGPLGLELAVALRQEELSYLHFDAGQIGATMQWWPAGTRWFSSPERISIAGVQLITPNQEKATREEYLAYLRGIVENFNLQIRTYEPVTSVRKSEDGFIVTSHPRTGPEPHFVRKVICATGGTTRPRLINVPGEDLPHVSHYFHDPHMYFQKQLMIVGGRNSAIETLLRCQRAGAEVSLSYRKDKLDPENLKYWLYPEAEGLLRSGRVHGYFNTTVDEITPTHVILRQADRRLLEVPADFVLLLTGYEADMTLLHQAGVILEAPDQVPVFNRDTMETNVQGLFIAGTAIAGTQQRYRVFLENCHQHVARIINALTGRMIPAGDVFALEQPES